MGPGPWVSKTQEVGTAAGWKTCPGRRAGSGQVRPGCRGGAQHRVSSPWEAHSRLAQAASVGASERRLHGASEPPWARGVHLRALCGHVLLPHRLPGTGALAGLTDQALPCAQESVIKTHGSESSKGMGLFEELQLPHHPEPLLRGSHMIEGQERKGEQLWGGSELR